MKTSTKVAIAMCGICFSIGVFVGFIVAEVVK